MGVLPHLSEQLAGSGEAAKGPQSVMAGVIGLLAQCADATVATGTLVPIKKVQSVHHQFQRP